MNTSSTTQAPRMVLTGVKDHERNPGFPPPVLVDEPEWCTRSAEDHAADDAGAPMHDGPKFGHCQTYVDSRGSALAALLYPQDGDDDVPAAELRQRAAYELAAAEWLEAHGSTESPIVSKATGGPWSGGPLKSLTLPQIEAVADALGLDPTRVFFSIVEAANE